jgi:Flp pilus assembly protein TadB
MSEGNSDSSGSKGRPTPKRNQVEAKRKINSLAPAKTKEAKAAQRESLKAARGAQRAAYLRGDERAMPARDRGPARRYARESIDSRRNVGEFFLPIVLIVLALSAVPSARVKVAATFFMYIALVAALIDGFILARRIKREVEERFPNEPTKGIRMYAWLRSTQLRRLRTPPATTPRKSK